MADTPVAALDHTMQQTNIWLKTLAEQLHIEDRHEAYSALRSVLHLLRDRLTPEQAVHLGAQSRFSFEGSTTTAGALRESQLTNGNRRSSQPSLQPTCPRRWPATRYG